MSKTFTDKLQADKAAIQEEHASLTKNVNKVML